MQLALAWLLPAASRTRPSDHSDLRLLCYSLYAGAQTANQDIVSYRDIPGTSQYPTRGLGEAGFQLIVSTMGVPHPPGLVFWLHSAAMTELVLV
jgi:hypothetical protein